MTDAQPPRATDAPRSIQGQDTDVTPERISRRDMLRRSAAVGGAAVLAAPMIQTIGMRSAFASSHSPLTPDPEFCLDDCAGKIVSINFTFNPAAASRFKNCDNDPAQACPQGPNQWSFSGDDLSLDYQAGDTFTVQIYQPPGQPRQTHAAATPGTVFSLTLSAQGDLKVVITNNRTQSSQTVQFHVSCSQQICIGDWFGSVEITGGVITR